MPNYNRLDAEHVAREVLAIIGADVLALKDPVRYLEMLRAAISEMLDDLEDENG